MVKRIEKNKRYVKNLGSQLVTETNSLCNQITNEPLFRNRIDCRIIYVKNSFT